MVERSEGKTTYVIEVSFDSLDLLRFILFAGGENNGVRIVEC